MSKAKDSSFYHRLSCDHIRTIDLGRTELLYGVSEVYCVACDDFRTVLGKVPRWDNSTEETNYGNGKSRTRGHIPNPG